ncbi:MAG: hypothetical protein ACTSRA_21175 [Promethearchaeota archaeon]
MPKGILIIKWDNAKGPLVFKKVPSSLEITNSLVNQIYSAHRYYSLKPGFSAISFHDDKIISFFSGIEGEIVGEPNFVVAMILRKDEPTKKFKDILLEDSKKILTHLHDKELEQMLSDLFSKMKKL